MKCSKHYEKDAVSKCINCGKALCSQCMNEFNDPLCDQCASNKVTEYKKLLLKNSILMVGLFILGFVLIGYISTGFGQRLFSGYFLAAIPCGWSSLKEKIPNMFSPSSTAWNGSIIYIFIILFISMIIGIFVTPYKMYKIISDIKGCKKGIYS